jgi:hypothetical protein
MMMLFSDFLELRDVEHKPFSLRLAKLSPMCFNIKSDEILAVQIHPHHHAHRHHRVN